MEALQKNVDDILELEDAGKEHIFDLIIERYSEYGDEDGKELLRQAYVVGSSAHDGQMRGSGAEYFTHPLLVAYLLIIHMPDAQTLSAAILHDVIEDTPVTEQDLEKSV